MKIKRVIRTKMEDKIKEQIQTMKVKCDREGERKPGREKENRKRTEREMMIKKNRREE